MDDKYFLSANSGEARASWDPFFFIFFLSPDFHELWRGHNGCLSFTEVVVWPQRLSVSYRSCGMVTMAVCRLQKLWRRHNDCRSFTEVTRRWATLVLGWVTASVHYLCLWWLFACVSRPKSPFALVFLQISKNFQRTSGTLMPFQSVECQSLEPELYLWKSGQLTAHSDCSVWLYQQVISILLHDFVLILP